MWQNIIFVGLGSIVGGVSRYFISEWSRHLFPSSFPWGTFIVNIAGCFLLGLLSGFFTYWSSNIPVQQKVCLK